MDFLSRKLKFCSQNYEIFYMVIRNKVLTFTQPPSQTQQQHQMIFQGKEKWD